MAEKQRCIWCGRFIRKISEGYCEPCKAWTWGVEDDSKEIDKGSEEIYCRWSTITS